MTDSVKTHSHLSLAEAQRIGALEEFILQAEKAGVGPIPQADFDAAASKVIKHEPQSDQTSRSSSRDGSTGRRTR